MYFKWLLPLLAFAFCFTLSAQQLTDSFSDSNFTSNPTWVGDDSLFQVNPLFQLQSKGTVAKTISLATSSTLSNNCEWSFWVRNNFSPSTQSFCRVYLISDTINPKQSVHGYYVQVGGVTGTKDSITLFKQNGTIHTKIIGGRPSTVGKKKTVRIKVIRHDNGNWELYSDTTGGNHFIREGAGTDHEFTASRYFGFMAKYNATNARNFYWDDVSVKALVIDTIPPVLDSIIVLSPYSLRLIFSEDLDSVSATDPSNYSITGIGNPITALFENEDKQEVVLNFLSPFKQETTYNLELQHIRDTSMNSLVKQTSSFFYFSAQTYDVVISEIMPDPDPPVNLPNAEYIELYNRSKHPVSLSQWSINKDNNSAYLPDETLLPNSFIILTSTTRAPLFENIGRCIGVTNYPALTNDNGTLVLKNQNGQVIHTLSYSSDWYRDNMKKNGGWSLEMIDPGNPCGISDNWAASTNRNGGTPGKENSVNASNKDHTGPQLLEAYPVSNRELRLTFNESLDSSTMFPISYYSITNYSGQIEGKQLIGPAYDRLILYYTDSFHTKTVYRVIADSVRDCAGNPIADKDYADFGMPEEYDSSEVLINEILFDPKTNGVDFVEVVNTTDKVIDLKKLYLANADDQDRINDFYPVASDGYLLFPQDYAVFTSDALAVMHDYFTPHPSKIITCKMPSFNHDKGTCILTTAEGKRYDEFQYDDHMHFALLDEKKGVSLERLDSRRPTNDRSNWTSASAHSGFATPTYRNSQYTNSIQSENLLHISPEVFSPDNDGFNDLVSFSYKTPDAGYTGNLYIFNDKGIMVKYLLKNVLLGREGTYSWDGITDQNQKAPIGIYTAYFEVFHLKGDVLKVKKSFVVGGKL